MCEIPDYVLCGTLGPLYWCHLSFMAAEVVMLLAITVVFVIAENDFDA